MSLNSKVVLSSLAATLGALTAWVLVDFNPFFKLSETTTYTSFMQSLSEQWFVGAIFGTLVGLSIGYINGLYAGSTAHLQRNLGWGAVVGFLAGIFGLSFGQLIFGSLYVNPQTLPPFSPLRFIFFLMGVIVRAIGWSVIGFFIGIAQGIVEKSRKTAKHGAIGGLIGGFLGGMLFELVPYIVPPGTKNVGVISRAFGMVVTGGAIGFFIGLVETLLKQAWIRVVAGRNEGKEYIITKPETTIGRAELSDIGLFGDRNIALTHAKIIAQQGRHLIRDAGSPIGTLVNGRRVTECFLKDGDIIEIGSMRLEFHEKATASKVPRQVDVSSPQAPGIPTTPGVCPYCGSLKDPRTGACACSIGTGVPDKQEIGAPTQQPQMVGAAPRLVGVSGPYTGQVFQLKEGETTIGREPGRDIELPLDTTISRRHARIVNERDSYVVYDEGSSNGTTVNTVRVTQQALKPGDIIAFGMSAFRFEQ